jgi:MYXO-CTERM domain-containing protein
VCIDTAACAALGNHISTPGYCPGPTNIQCCTATKPLDDAGPTKPDASVEPDASVGKPDAAADGEVDGAKEGGNEDGATGQEGGIEWPSSSTGGCAATPAPSTSFGAAALLAGIAAFTVRRRRRR